MPLLNKRKCTLTELENLIDSVKSLDRDNPTGSTHRKFCMYETELDKILLNLSTDNREFMNKLLTGGLAAHDRDFKEDQTMVEMSKASIFDVFDTYREILKAKHFIKDPIPAAAAPGAPPSDFIQALNLCLKNNNDTQVSALKVYSDSLKEISKSNINIKRPQPKFTPDGTIDDYFRYREWFRKFEFYTAKIDQDDYNERMEWLRNCVYGDALTLIQACPSTQEGYDAAIELLEGQYKNKEVITESLYDYFHKFTIPSMGKNYKTLKEKSTQLRNYLHELEVELENPFDYKQYLGHVYMKTLPPEVKKEFMLSCDSLTPNIETIFEKADEVIRKLNVYSEVNPSFPDLNKKSVNSANTVVNTSTQNQLSTSSKSTKSKKSKTKSSALNVLGSEVPAATHSQDLAKAGKPNAGQRYLLKYPSKCRFCSSPNHASKYCGKYQTVQERWNYLISVPKSDGSKLCRTCCHTKCDGQDSSHDQKSLCNFSFCLINSKTKHAKVLCQEFIKANLTNLTQNAFIVPADSTRNHHTASSKYDPAEPESLTYSINVAGRKARTTALETALLLAQNEEASHLPPHDRHVALMTDTCSQRSVVAKHIVDKYKFPIIGTESVALQGFNERSPRCMNYKVVQITIGKDNKRPICLDALVVHDINSIMMVGAAAFAKKVARVGNLADFRFLSTKSDEVSIDLLVGAEHRWKIVSPVLRPRQVYGMWCPKTIYGDLMLTGSIPGASGVITDSIAGTNTVTLLNVNALPHMSYLLENDEYSLKPSTGNVTQDLGNFNKLSSNNSVDQLSIESNLIAMPLHELVSNSPEVNLKFKAGNIATDILIQKSHNLCCNYNEDPWTNNISKSITSKRLLLSDLARIFYPLVFLLGILAILTNRGKLILQEVWKGVFTRDGVLPPKVQTPWTILMSRINLILDIQNFSRLGALMKGSVFQWCLTDTRDLARSCGSYFLQCFIQYFVQYFVQDIISKFHIAKANIFTRWKFYYFNLGNKLTALLLGFNYFHIFHISLIQNENKLLNFFKSIHFYFHIYFNSIHFYFQIIPIFHIHNWNKLSVYFKLIILELWRASRQTKTHKGYVQLFNGTIVGKDLAIHCTRPSHPQVPDFLQYFLERKSYHFKYIISYSTTLDGSRLTSQPGRKILRKQQLNLNLHFGFGLCCPFRIFKGLTCVQFNLMPSEVPYSSLIYKSTHKIVGHVGLTFTYSLLYTVAAVFKQRILHFMANTDPDYIPFTTNILVFERNLRTWSHDMVEFSRQDPEVKLSNRVAFPTVKWKLRDILTYIPSNKSSPHKTSLISLRSNHYVLIKDEEIVSASEMVAQNRFKFWEKLSRLVKDLANSNINNLFRSITLGWENLSHRDYGVLSYSGAEAVSSSP